MITGTAYVDLSAAYDTVNHRLLNQKLYNTTLDSQLCRVIQNMLSDQRFYVELNNEQSRWSIQKNGLSSTLFNIYMNDQPILDGTRSFIYADDLCITAQYPTFQEVKQIIEEALGELTHYYSSNSCCLPTPMTLASGGGESDLPACGVHQPASPSIWPAVIPKISPTRGGTVRRTQPPANRDQLLS